MKTSAKQSITLTIIQRNGGRKDYASRFRVSTLVNRIEPEVGSVLNGPEVERLIGEANRPFSKLTVNIKE